MHPSQPDTEALEYVARLLGDDEITQLSATGGATGRAIAAGVYFALSLAAIAQAPAPAM